MDTLPKIAVAIETILSFLGRKWYIIIIFNLKKYLTCEYNLMWYWLSTLLYIWPWLISLFSVSLYKLTIWDTLKQLHSVKLCCCWKCPFTRDCSGHLWPQFSTRTSRTAQTSCNSTVRSMMEEKEELSTLSVSSHHPLNFNIEAIIIEIIIKIKKRLFWICKF